MELENGLAFGPRKMLHPGGPEAERALRHFTSRRLIKLPAHAKVESTLEDSDVLDLGMDVR